MPAAHLYSVKKILSLFFLFVAAGSLTLRAQNVYFLQYYAPTPLTSVSKANISSIPTSTMTTLVSTSSFSNVAASMMLYHDSINGYVYWSENGANSIYRLSTGGSFPATTATQVVQNLSGPKGIRIDNRGSGTIYYASSGGDWIKKKSLASLPIAASSGTDVVTGIDVVAGIALDISTSPNKVYWVDNGTSTTIGKRIHRADVNTTTTASSGTVVALSNSKGTQATTDRPDNVVIDHNNHYVYWNDFSTNSTNGAARIARVSTNASMPATGTTVATFTANTFTPQGLTIDLNNNRLYFANNAGGSNATTNKIQRLNLSGCCPVSTFTDVVTGLGQVRDIKLDFGNAFLPVDLVYFTAGKMGNDVLLKWGTATEQNNSHFEMERSLDGQKWENIGRVTGNGNSSMTHEYSFTDHMPAEEHMSVYYRFTQFDFNGAHESGPVRVVSYHVPFGYELMNHPFNDVSQLNIKAPVSGNCGVEVSNSIGVRVINDHLEVHEGSNFYNLGYMMNKLSQGVYILTLTSPEGEIKSLRILKK